MINYVSPVSNKSDVEESLDNGIIGNWGPPVESPMIDFTSGDHIHVSKNHKCDIEL